MRYGFSLGAHSHLPQKADHSFVYHLTYRLLRMGRVADTIRSHTPSLHKAPFTLRQFSVGKLGCRSKWEGRTALLPISALKRYMPTVVSAGRQSPRENHVLAALPATDYE